MRCKLLGDGSLPTLVGFLSVLLSCSARGGSGLPVNNTDQDAQTSDASGSDVCGNSADDDGDGRIDEDCVCRPGNSRTCFDGPQELIGVGTCRSGTQVCTGGAEFGTWTGPCIGQRKRLPETCDAIDNDCNGKVDDGVACQCNPGATRSCYGGDPKTQNVGICKTGTQTCIARTGGGAWGGCEGQVLPAKEQCGHPGDEDCDGLENAADPECQKASCTQQVIGDAAPEVDLLLVVDASASLKDSWGTVKAALRSLLPQVENQMSLGLYVFPNSICGVSQFIDVNFAKGNANAINDFLGRLPKPDGGTPEPQAIDQAGRLLKATTSSHRQVVALLTDGESTEDCGNTIASTVDSITKLRTMGYVFTIAVATGKPDVNALEAFAAAGGWPRRPSPSYYNLTTGQGDLLNAFQAIPSMFRGCEYTLAKRPPDPTKVVLFVDGAEIASVFWRWTNSTYTNIRIVEDPCARLLGGLATEVSACGL